jgi:hypothetical protein
MANLSRVTFEANTAVITYLAAEQQQRKMIAARITAACTDGKPSKAALKLAAEAIAARTTAAQLPVFITPDELTLAVVGLGIPADVAEGVVGRLVAGSDSIKPAEELPDDKYVAELLTSHLAVVPQLHGIRSIRPTSSPAPQLAHPPDAVVVEPITDENPATEGDWHDLARPEATA